jgi:hypothetical protein
MAKFDFKGMLTNQTVLYVLLFLSVFSIIGYLIVGNLDAVLFFVLAGFITSFFSKNMIVVLLVALLSTNFVWSGVLRVRREGLDNMNQLNDKEKKKDDKKMVEADESSLNTGSKQVLPKTNMNMAKNMPIQSKDKLPMKMDDELFKGDKDDMDAKNKMTSGNGNKLGTKKLSPSDVDESNSTPKIDHAATVEMAYDNMQNALGTDGIKKLTDDTMRLLDKQEKLQESLSNLTPLFEKAQNVLTNFDMSKVNNILGNFDMSQFNKVFDQFGLNPIKSEEPQSKQEGLTKKRY